MRMLSVLLLVTFSALLRIWPLQALGASHAWLTFYPTVVLAAMIGGFSSGILATLLVCVTVSTLWPWFSSQPLIHNLADWLGVGVFALTGVLISVLAESQHRAHNAAKLAKTQAEASARAAASNEHFIKSITDAMPGMVGYWDRSMRCRFANQAYQVWFGKTPEQLIGHTLMELLGPELFALNLPYIHAVLTGVPQMYERALTKADGCLAHTWANYIPDLDAEGKVVGFFVLVTDVTPIKEAEAGLRLAASVFQNTTEGIFITDDRGRILSVNPSFSEITGFSAQEAIGQTPRLLKSNHHDQEFHAGVWQEIINHGEWKGELWNRRKSGELYLEWQTITKISGVEGDPVRYVSLFHDITDDWRKDEALRFLAFHDALTGLPNRSLLQERLERHIVMTEREPRALALMFLDLDGFKTVNDSLGHEVGDDLLKTVALQLQNLVRHIDTVARLGGDEFVIMLDNPSSRDEVQQIALRILETLHQPMEVSGKSVQIGASIGIAMTPEDGASPAELINSADVAMYAAKLGGKNNYRFFDHSMNAASGRTANPG
jgi:diguanylate cyclase (GGDEF)-like protein/PAS domain S-box-containing protein